MTRFLVYLLETGICLSLLFVAYWLFLRKETYFNFIRIFLVGSILLILLVPLLHVKLAVSGGGVLGETATNVLKFRSSYEEMIRIINADFGTEPAPSHVTGSTQIADHEGGFGRTAMEPGNRVIHETDSDGISRQGSGGIAPSRILLIIYIIGVLYFSVRFLYLVIRLSLLIRRNGVSRQDGFRMVEIREDISPFSFFRFLFINRDRFSEAEMQNVLEHEKAHIRQRHSLDHLLAHGLAVFQWFNPLAWQLRKALKTTHEYIADHQVIHRGYEVIDYQSLLLKQVIGYHSVELVNNFNLKPIKKRIAMMSKKKSGISARLKATLVIPFALAIFFLFADFTLMGSGTELQKPVAELKGLWVKQSKDVFSPSVFISDNRLAYSEGLEIREFYLRIEQEHLILSQREGGPGTSLKFKMNQEELVLWWNDSQSSRYKRSAASNTLDHIVEDQGVSMELPHLTQYRLLDEERVFWITYGKDPRGGNVLKFNGETMNLVDLEELIVEEKKHLNKMDQESLTALFLIDGSIPMILVDQVRKELRKIGSLHFAEGGYPHGDLNLSPLLYHAVALPRLLPPLHAKKLDKKDVEKGGGKIHTIDLSLRNTSPGEVSRNLEEFIGNCPDGKYIISLEYDQDIPYGQYIETVDMIFNAVYKFRKALALEEYGVAYENLGDDLQRKIRRAYPMAMSETLSD